MPEYEQVMTNVGNILLSYDSDGSVPFFGFGAKLEEPCMLSSVDCILIVLDLSASKANIPHERGGHVSQCFHINGNPNDAEVNGGLSSKFPRHSSKLML